MTSLVTIRDPDNGAIYCIDTSTPEEGTATICRTEEPQVPPTWLGVLFAGLLIAIGMLIGVLICRGG